MVALFVALMFVALVLTDLVVEKVRARRAAAIAGTEVPWKVPKGFYLSEGHTWSHPDSSLGMRVGVDALVAHAMGTAENVLLPEVDALVEAGQSLFGLGRQGRELKIPSSITGRVVAVNSRLARHPELVAEDPYGVGWICAISPLRAEGDSSSISTGEKAALWLEQELHRLRDFLSRQASPDLALSVTLADGGLPVVGSLRELPISGWRAFEAEFLAPARTEGDRE